MTHRLPFGLAEAVCGGLVLGLVACGKSAPPLPSRASPSPRAAVRATPSGEMTAAMAAWLADPRSGGLHPSAEEQTALARIYPASSESPIWVDSTGHPTRSAQEALTAFVDAAAEGLDPADYRALELSTRRTNLDAGSRPDPREVAVFDVEVSLSIMRYLRHFHRGRVDPSELGLLMTLPVDEHDYAGLARDAALKGRVRETIASMTPPLVQYRSLRSVLPRYRALALIDEPALPQAPARSIKPGDTAPGLDILRNRLIALHDLPETTVPLADPSRYEGHLVEGVRRFQIRHGLENDGVLGKATWAVLNVPFRWRVRQIEMAMERLRWLPHLGERPFIAVNIPMFRLWGWDRVPETGAPDFGMGVIVGKAALDTKTPVFLGEMKYLTLRPYWNVPKSILQKEILPLLRRNLGYLERQDMEMVDGPGDDARRVAATSENVDRLAQGKLRLRQRPGTKNALGPIAFIFPNDMNVYLHGTPAPELFERTRRDFSHGCVRVEDPLALAEWALKDRPEWTREKILAALRGTETLRVPLTRPIRVVMYYVTAAVMPEDNSVRFAEDIYGHDSRLARALAARRRAS